MKKVWVTLTEPSARRLASLMTDAGLAPLVAPATEILPLPWELPSETPKSLICLSQHAAAAFLRTFEQCPAESQQRLLAQSKVIAVGRRTAGLFQYAGFAVLKPDNESSEGLLALRELIPQSQGGLLSVHDRVWLLSGKEGRNIIYDALVEKCELTRCDLYQRHDATLPRLNTSGIHSVVVGSIHGLGHAANHWQQCGGDLAVSIVTPSERVQQHALKLGFKRSFNAQGSAPEAFVRCLKDHLDFQTLDAGR